MNRNPLYFLISTIAIIVFFIYATFTLNFYTIKSPLESPAFAQILGATGTLLVTVVLATLYWEQTNIQNRQEKWMAAEHKPLPAVEVWNPKGNLIDIGLLNYGNGIARNFRLEARINPAVSNVPYWADSFTSDVVSLFPPGSANNSLETDRDKPQKFVIEEIHKFREIKVGSTQEFNFLDYTANLQQKDIEEFSLKIEIRYDYIAEKSGSITLFLGDIYLSQPMNLEEAIDEAIPDHDQIEAPLPN